jgi:hypothetical protein
MDRKPYSAAMTKFLFWFQEFKTIVLLLNKGMPIGQIKDQNTQENLLQAKTPYRSRLIFNAVAARIEELPKGFLEIFEKTDFPTQKLINFIAILNHDSLFFDFLYEIYREKLITGVELLTEGDISQFFKNKQAQDERVAAWTPHTFNRIARAYKGILLNAGLLRRGKVKEWYIERTILNGDLANALKAAEMAVYIAALTGETL